MFGRRRPIPELTSGNFMQRQFGERVAMNSPIQGSAADIMKIAMINVAKELKEKDLKSKIVLQVHDELLIEAYENEVEQIMGFNYQLCGCQSVDEMIQKMSETTTAAKKSETKKTTTTKAKTTKSEPKKTENCKSSAAF